ncbi:DUF2442 domain-containing protein [Synechocystis sp. FACHB-383]|uniref:DUF2442 domain-containing protein n=1 Tax=Synechocystis sp. FACHB-383 TaxID=2692864 RepID=UPI0018EF83CA|nr:DUF2442 domain-containing protein [Synechocystis sp. FACHB-383]
MNFSTIKILDTLLIQKVTITDEVLSVDLSDGRSISVSLLWYSRLLHGSQEECQDYRLIAGGMGIHWNQLEEDISVKKFGSGPIVWGKSAIIKALVRRSPPWKLELLNIEKKLA